jgi:DNA-binding NtrC family response regulator
MAFLKRPKTLVTDFYTISTLYMKNIIFYSPDFSMCYSLLMFLQETYRVTTTTDMDILKNIVTNSGFDIVILDAEPSEKIVEICKSVSEKKLETPVVLTYVYNNRTKKFEENIRKYINSIFYKPFDLNEVSLKLSTLVK